MRNRSNRTDWFGVIFLWFVGFVFLMILCMWGLYGLLIYKVVQVGPEQAASILGHIVSVFLHAVNGQ